MNRIIDCFYFCICCLRRYVWNYGLPMWYFRQHRLCKSYFAAASIRSKGVWNVIECFKSGEEILYHQMAEKGGLWICCQPCAYFWWFRFFALACCGCVIFVIVIFCCSNLPQYNFFYCDRNISWSIISITLKTFNRKCCPTAVNHIIYFDYTSLNFTLWKQIAPDLKRTWVPHHDSLICHP